jgi:hypothetical protein
MAIVSPAGFNWNMLFFYTPVTVDVNRFGRHMRTARLDKQD